MNHLDNDLLQMWWRVTLSTAALFLACASFAATVEVTVIDRDGEPVSNVAVYVQGNHAGSLPAPMYPAVMDQIDTRFVPHLLVVQTGTRVEFPNSDAIAHHVYSFSKPNNFMLPLYKGELQPQVTFGHDGVVTVGCNIHDHMLAYILVVDSQVFGKTGYDGRVQLNSDNPDGLAVTIWSPRIKLKDEIVTRTVGAGNSAQITFSLTEKLRAAHSNGSDTLSWNAY